MQINRLQVAINESKKTINQPAEWVPVWNWNKVELYEDLPDGSPL
jgi:hypothetical protein